MQKLFSPDSLFMRIMGRVGDLLLLNFFFLLTSIPIVTIGASAAALYTVTFQFDTDREAGIISGYFRAFRANWKQATAVWLILLLCGGSACFNAFLFYTMSGVLRYLSILFALLLALALLTAGYAFPLVSQFENRVAGTLKNAFALSLGYLPRSILILLLNLLPLIVFLSDVYLFFQTAFVWAAIYFAAAAYGISLLLKPILERYLK